MTAHSSPTRIPLPLLLVNGVGALMMAAGMRGLVAPDVVPALARPAVAYALLGVGLTLDIAAVLSIVRIAAHRGAVRRPPGLGPAPAAIAARGLAHLRHLASAA